MNDVARLAGVSTATVSRALRGRNVSGPVAERVVAAARELRYVINTNASRLASGDVHTVGLLSPELTSWYTSEVVAGVADVLADERYDLLLGAANVLIRDRVFAGNAEFQQRTDGAILVDVFCNEEGARDLAAGHVPVVVTGERLEAVSSVSIDNALGGRLAARHLIELGHRRIALVGGLLHPNITPTVPRDRTAGFTSELALAGLQVPPDWLAEGKFSIAGGREATLRLMRSDEPPTAIFLLSDEMAFGAMHALRILGIEVGREVSLIGFDDHSVAEAVGLTTIRQPVRQIGRVAARALLERIGGGGQPQHYPIEVSLIRRASTAPAQFDHEGRRS